jgi:hypothetical protein
MAYLPVYCASCDRASLASKAGGELRICAFCEGPARVVPGPLYGDGDWLAFAEIDQAVFAAALEAAEARALTDELQQMLTQREKPSDVVQRLTERLPSLAKCRPALVNDVQRGLRMLATQLLARSRDEPPLGDAARRGVSPE